MRIIYGLVVSIASVLAFFSCQDFMDVHKEYIQGGEIVYAPKPDTLTFIAGKQRILFNCRTYNALNVRTIDVYWNEGLDSLIIPVSLKTGYDSISVMLDNMEEKSYTFNVRTTDNFGYKSLVLTNFGTSYGALYQSRIVNRRVRSVSLSDQGATVNWFFAPVGLVRNEIRYMKNSGEHTVVASSSEKDVVVLPDAKGGSVFEYRSLYIPEKQSVDTFATDWERYEKPFPDEYKYSSGSWVVLSASDESVDYRKEALLDGDLGTFWHSAYEGGDAPLPHWAVIDMQMPRKVSRIEVFRRAGNSDAKSVELYLSDHPDAESDNWIKVGSGVFDNDVRISITVPPSLNVGAHRYLKLFLPDSNNRSVTSVAEIYVFGN